MQTAFAVLGAVLGWALLHGSLTRLPRWFVRWIEASPDSPERRGPRSRAVDWCAHMAAACVVLVALRGLFVLWTSDLWFLPRDDGSKVLLGVDWYFVNAGESATAGEVFVLLGFGVVGSIVLRRP